MVRRRKLLAGAAATVALAGTLAGLATSGASAAVTAASAKAAAGSAPGEFLVVFKQGQREAALGAIKGNGGVVVKEDAKLGYALVRAFGANFAEGVSESRSAIVGVARNQPIGHVPKGQGIPQPRDVKGEDDKVNAKRGTRVTGATPTAATAPKAKKGEEPLAGLQWDMKMIGATATGSHAKERGSKKVLVGVIDTGIDGKHPDIAPNFNRELSRNFTVDIPHDANGAEIDGKCEYANCVDPADVDHDGHGTHVASTIGSPINGLGMAGIAPNVSLVNLRAGQDSGYFFLKPTLDALTYAGDKGIDVVNMSFYVDPWLYNCAGNAADSPAESSEQRAIIEATQRAVNYARARGVTLISALGNDATDLGNPKVDESSPGFPKGAEKTRKVDNTCVDVPTELQGVISVSSVGQSKRKAYYSNYGIEQTDLAAPGGDTYDNKTKQRDVRGAILAAAPANVLWRDGLLNKNGTPKKDSGVIRDCKPGKGCAYYQYLQGTSMAAPHATGVAALIISRFGNGKLSPSITEARLYSTATDTACPSPRTYTYTRYPVDPETGKPTKVTDSHTCVGTKVKNGFYGRGIVNALAAATAKR
ncbi:S8 family peptidase [Bailinhaonella thermotolerans]|uniref:Peptidase S8 and S53 subtilisin kexin sedolisin n=1 Tax=Bailinhaonella thermotolerans TaxID=1070861 RepID=A0A3A4A9C1_9ACTN|nr:S8 family serine peptidase [Bailinhaonella thermotolerans]RJL24721.1 peptidase S8 and S53 subtilisin kexin sedolisin [Bailinhaonella thermotolerans]